MEAWIHIGLTTDWPHQAYVKKIQEVLESWIYIGINEGLAKSSLLEEVMKSWIRIGINEGLKDWPHQAYLKKSLSRKGSHYL